MLSSKSMGMKLIFMSFSSVKIQTGRKYGCEARIVSYYYKNGHNKRRLFWRCPFWHGDDTFDLFIWDEDFFEAKDVNGVWNVNGNKLKDLEDVKLLRELYEASKKKNNKL